MRTAIVAAMHEELAAVLALLPDERRQAVQRLPSPGDEFRLVASAARADDVDLAVIAGEAQRVPFLRLSAVAAAPGLADDVRRNVVGQPVGDLAEALDRTDVRLLVELP